MDVKQQSEYLEELDDDLKHLSTSSSRRRHSGPTKKSNGLIAEVEEADSDLENKEDMDVEAIMKALQPGGSRGVIPLSQFSSHPHQPSTRKARQRALRSYSVSEAAPSGGSHHNAQRTIKNSRKSRSNLGRGLPKKGGAGGKGTWGKVGCELDLPWVDRNDPNYESENEEIHSKNVTLKTLVPEMSEEDVRKAVEPIILEFFENNDSGEVLISLEEMLGNIGSRRWMVVSIIIELAMEHKPSHREMASTLISDLYQKVVSQRDIGTAFDDLLSQLSDLILDTPDAPIVLGNFLARAIADDCIPPKFLYSHKDHVQDEDQKKALKKADTLLSMKHGLVRLDNVWGVGGGVRPVKYLVKQIVLLLKEYLSSGDIEEATRCLQELEVPHFHHELVYEAIVMVIDKSNVSAEDFMSKLLQSLFRSCIITQDAFKEGFFRVFELMPDIAIDVPNAYVILERFVERSRKAGYVTEDIIQRMPSRNRKRFVSEGDGLIASSHNSKNLWF